jgi:hypothetical protein
VTTVRRITSSTPVAAARSGAWNEVFDLHSPVYGETPHSTILAQMSRWREQ